MSPLERHLADRYHRGICEAPTQSNSGRNRVCGDELTLALRMAAGKTVEAAYFEARGCLISQAAASFLCEHIEGSDLAKLAQISDEQFLALLGTRLSPVRRECALLSLRVLRKMIESVG